MVIGDAKEFGNAIRERRKALNYTQAYIASFTGFSTSFISDLENGKRILELLIIGKTLRQNTKIFRRFTMLS